MSPGVVSWPPMSMCTTWSAPRERTSSREKTIDGALASFSGVVGKLTGRGGEGERALEIAHEPLAVDGGLGAERHGRAGGRLGGLDVGRRRGDRRGGGIPRGARLAGAAGRAVLRQGLRRRHVQAQDQ